MYLHLQMIAIKYTADIAKLAIGSLLQFKFSVQRLYDEISTESIQPMVYISKKNNVFIIT